MSHGDFDYEKHGAGYATKRRPDPHIAEYIHRALGDARTVLNVGAGAGSYEPVDRYVAAVEPSASMRSQRPAHLAPAINAIAESLPFDDDAFDAAMATVTIHQWSDTFKGLAEMRRVTRGPIVILTFDGDLLDRYWLADYAPELIELERRRYPAISKVARAIGSPTTTTLVPIPIDCVDGFTEAFYARPERMLEDAVRRGHSAWGLLSEGLEEASMERLRAELEAGEWDRKYAHLRTQPTFEGSLTLLVGQGSPT